MVGARQGDGWGWGTAAAAGDGDLGARDLFWGKMVLARVYGSGCRWVGGK